MTATTLCAYRAGDGRMCAVGCLITDDNYELHLEGLTIGHGDVAEAVAKSFGVKNLSLQCMRLLVRLQNIHDSALSWTVEGLSQRGEDHLQDVAIKYNLVYTPPKE